VSVDARPSADGKDADQTHQVTTRNVQHFIHPKAVSADPLTIARTEKKRTGDRPIGIEPSERKQHGRNEQQRDPEVKAAKAWRS